MLAPRDLDMATMEVIGDVCRRIAEEFHPERIVLFGSYARGNPTPDSDVDLLVIMPLEERPVDKSVAIRLRIRPPFPVDILVRSPAAVRERLALGDSFLRRILDEGNVLYETPHP
jgi:predicted nucleotidyltransferase